MRLEKLRQVDLNLLIIFAVIAEERSVTKASARLLLSQPAVSRALQRARSMFQDELVIRSSSGFELTLRGRKILQELEQILPKIERMVVPSVFDPKRERSHFRISGPDNVCMALLPHLCRRYTTERYKVNFDFLPWQADATDMLEGGKLDLILHVDDGLLPSHFSSERLLPRGLDLCCCPPEQVWRSPDTEAVPGCRASHGHNSSSSRGPTPTCGEARRATPIPSHVSPTARPTLTWSLYAKARTSRDGCSASWSGPLAGAFWKRRLKTPSRQSKPGTARLERQARHEPGTRTVEFILQCQQI
jgi:DNA-binding transcriptional LysR family regulator